MGRILTGDALSGETDRLRQRINQFFERLETQLKQILRTAEQTEGLRTELPAGATANLMLACAEGRIRQFVRSEFKAPSNDKLGRSMECYCRCSQSLSDH